MNGSPGSPLQPEAGMREAGEREDRNAETLCHGELPLPCPPVPPKGLSPLDCCSRRDLGAGAPVSHPKGPLPFPVLTVGLGR